MPVNFPSSKHMHSMRALTIAAAVSVLALSAQAQTQAADPSAG